MSANPRNYLCMAVATALLATATWATAGNDDDDELVPVEVNHDYYAQALNGDVHYCGEVARNFEDGALSNLDETFQNDG